MLFIFYFSVDTNDVAVIPEVEVIVIEVPLGEKNLIPKIMFLTQVFSPILSKEDMVAIRTQTIVNIRITRTAPDQDPILDPGNHT